MLGRTSHITLKLGRSLIGLFVLLCGVSMQAQVRAELDSAKIKIGEELRYRLIVEADTTDLVQMPEGQTFLPMEVIETYPIDTSYNAQRHTLIREYGLTQFDSGQYMIPKQKVLIGDREFFTDSLLIEIDNVVVDTTKQKMFDIRERLDVGTKPVNLLWLWIALGILAIGVGVYFFLKRKKELEEAEELIPPYEEAIAALQAFDNSPLALQKGSKDYYSALTEIVKRYLDREIDPTALESTSGQLITRLQMHKDSGNFDFSDTMIRTLDSILKRADLVKFAKMDIASEIADADRKELEEVVNQTNDAIPEPTEEDLLEDLKYQEELRRKQIRKRWIVGTVSFLAVLLVTTGILGATMGFDTLKEKVVGHPTKRLLEGRWYNSDYGNPAVILETPDILVRTEVDLQLDANAQEVVKSNDFFQMEDERNELAVIVNITEFNQPIEPDLKDAVENALSGFEQQGVQNMYVKEESFSTDKGINGTKAFGSFNEVKKNGDLGDRINYELYLFSQTGALQQVFIISGADNPHMEEVVSRIVASIELEIDIKQPQIGNPQ